MYKSLRTIGIFFLTFQAFALCSQNEEVTDSVSSTSQKKFQFGLFIGPYFANKSTANLYDGYGLDFEGNRNNFENSYMYNKIILQYGGGLGEPDLIAQELNVQHSDWRFSESDMPVYMKYVPAFLIGLQGRYSVDNKNIILLNINAAKLTITGGFTITTLPQSNSNQLSKTIHEFTIKGTEQRLLLQLGYQHLFGKSERVNILAEGGLNITLAKSDRNEILINNLKIDLTSYYYIPGYSAYYVRKRVGTGFGAFTGIGVNFNASESFTIQFVYNPTFEDINIGLDSKLKWQHAAGLRAYYKL